MNAGAAPSTPADRIRISFDIAIATAPPFALNYHLLDFAARQKSQVLGPRRLESRTICYGIPRTEAEPQCFRVGLIGDQLFVSLCFGDLRVVDNRLLRRSRLLLFQLGSSDSSVPNMRM